MQSKEACILMVVVGLATLGVIEAAAAEGESAASPLRIIGEHRNLVGVHFLDLDEAAANDLRQAGHVNIEAFPLDAQTTVDLELATVEIFAPDAQIISQGPDGARALDRPEITLLSGRVADRPDSRVFLGLSPQGSNGIIAMGESTWIISSGPAGGEMQTIIYELGALPEDAIAWTPFHCAVGELIDAAPAPGPAEADDDGRHEIGGNDCRVADVAVETDWEFTGDLFDGNPILSSAYATQLIAAVSEIYTRDLNVRLRISWLRVWSDSDDPWDEDNTIDQIYQFRDYWQANMGFVPRHVAHFLSGRALGGGVAWLPGVCNGDHAYGLSANINGYFPYPLQDNHPQNGDLMVVAHELGHNFGAPHTHEHVPQIDNCAGGDCIPNGTIMSYCHTCDGGMINIVLAFHPMIQDDMLDYIELEMECDIDVAPVVITVPPQDQIACIGGWVTFEVSAVGDPPITYQWRKDGMGIPGTNIASLVLEDITLEDAGTYDVVVSNPCGDAVSDPAALTVLPGEGADLDCDGVVDVNDLLILLAAWGEMDDPADLNGDGIVDVLDLLALVDAWG